MTTEEHLTPADLEMLRRDIENDVRDTKPPRTFHHPRCPAVSTGDVSQCTCYGWMLPA